MTVGRTEKPATPEGWKPPRKDYGEEMRDNMKRNAGPDGVARGADDSAKPIKRHKIGAGSYEDPSDERARARRPKKSGRPGR
jgi:excinuclease ABC subunit B